MKKLTVHVTEEMAEGVELGAAKKGISTSEYIRRALEDKAPPEIDVRQLHITPTHGRPYGLNLKEAHIEEACVAARAYPGEAKHIAFIKALRNATGIGLLQAKAAYDLMSVDGKPWEKKESPKATE